MLHGQGKIAYVNGVCTKDILCLGINLALVSIFGRIRRHMKVNFEMAQCMEEEFSNSLTAAALMVFSKITMQEKKEIRGLSAMELCTMSC